MSEIDAATELSPAQRAYVARVADYWSAGGLTHAAGSILGLLSVCEPAAQTQAAIASALSLSAGSVSTQLRTLVSAGMVERLRVDGSRARAYQLPPDMWVRILGTEDRRIAGLRVLADEGLAVLPATRPDRIASLDQLVRFFEGEWPRIAQRLDEFLTEDQRLREEGS